MADDVLARTRIVVLALGVSPPVLTVLFAVGLADATRSVPSLSSLAAILGLLAAPVAWRVYLLQRERTAAATDAAERERSFFRSRLLPVSITEGCALVGGVAYAFTREPWALAGIAAHVLLVGAVWPRESSREELDPPVTGARNGGAS